MAKFLIFAEWTTFVKGIAFHLRNNNYVVRTYTGDLSTEHRDEVVQDFQSPSTKLDCLVLTTGSGGEGLNLTAANHIFLMNAIWNPMKELQAEAGAHMMKQLLPVTVHQIRLPVRIGQAGNEPTLELDILKKQAMKSWWVENAAGTEIKLEKYEVQRWWAHWDMLTRIRSGEEQLDPSLYEDDLIWDPYETDSDGTDSDY